MKTVFLTFFIFLIYPVVASASNFGITQSIDVAVHETSYTAHGESCSIEWVLKRFPASGGIGISERSKCELDVAAQSDYRLALLKNVAQDSNNLRGMRNFYWGRLKRGDKNDEYSRRLVQAAGKSRHWDATTGKLVKYSGGVNNFVKDILNQNKVFSELAQVFEKQGYLIKVNGVEKVLIDNVSATDSKSSAGGKLPFDCVVSFEVLPK